MIETCEKCSHITNHTRGDEWLTKEGRAELRETFKDADDGNAVLPLLNALEKVEAELSILKKKLVKWSEIMATASRYLTTANEIIKEEADCDEADFDDASDLVGDCERVAVEMIVSASNV